MNYSYLDLVFYFLIYSFLGWAAEVVFFAVRDHKLRNRGFFNLPFCLSYGVVMDILIVMLPTMNGRYVEQYVTSLVVASVVTFLSAALAKRVSRTVLWQYQENNLFSGRRKQLLLGLLHGLAFYAAYLLLHPLIFTLVELLPDLVIGIISLVLAVLLAADFVTILVILRRGRTPEAVEKLRQESRKQTLAQRICHAIWHRLDKAYPEWDAMERPAGKPIFAEGVCFDKLVWVFLITSFLGDIIETFYCRIVGGIWMSRSSLIYGTFSVVWGIGAVVLTVVLRRLAGKEDRYIFLAGCVIGGVYEYLCSVFTEYVFGTTFWDYSEMPFNFGGRTNLLFCIFWGLLAVAWMKLLYPPISRLVEKIPPVTGKVLTWIVLVLLILDAILSAGAMLRYVARQSDPIAHNAVEQFLDMAYPDKFIQWLWPNMNIS